MLNRAKHVRLCVCVCGAGLFFSSVNILSFCGSLVDRGDNDNVFLSLAIAKSKTLFFAVDTMEYGFSLKCCLLVTLYVFQFLGSLGKKNKRKFNRLCS